jgi:putative peptidoglycan lipid II flippase
VSEPGGPAVISSVPVAAPGRNRGSDRTGTFALLVAAGILFSRVAGLVRDRAFAHFFGSGAAADALRAAFRIPNLLQNLFGEGVLSASFIPVYAKLLAEGRREDADRVAAAIFTLLAGVSAIVVALGVWGAPAFIAAIAPGFEGEKRELTVLLVRIFFPGAGVLALSAWCLGVLNSHRRFFLSYASPVMWNLAIITALIGFGPRSTQEELAQTFAWASLAGSVLQLLVQLPTVFKVAPGLWSGPVFKSEDTRTVLRNFGPVFVSRGVYQLSAYIDAFLASFLPTGGLAFIGYAQTLYMLPVSLFGMSISAAELPQMSGVLGSDEEIAAQLRQRLNAGLRRIAFFIIPSAVAFLALGDVVSGIIYQTGHFDRSDSVFLWAVLAGAAMGLLPSTLGRLYSSTYYALRDTRTPLLFAIIRVVASSTLGYLGALVAPRMLGLEPRWGAVGITGAASAVGFVEVLLLRFALNRRIGVTGVSLGYQGQLWLSAGVSAAAAWGVKWVLGVGHPLVLGLAALGLYGVTYFALTALLRIPESAAVLQRVGRVLGRLRRR